MKRTVLVLMMLAVLFGSMFAATACAETVLRNGIEVTLTTDKESYHALDVIDAKLTVKNTNSFSVRNVSMEIKAPQGYMLTGNGETDVGNLSAGETQQQQAGMRDTLADAPALPQTGDDSRVMLWGILFVLSSAALCALVIRHPHGRRIMSLLLCVVLVGPYLLEAVPVLAQENAANEMIMVSKEVLVNGESVLLTGVVMYLEEQKNAQEEQNTSASGLRINDTETYVKVREGDKLAFSGMISASEGAAVSSVQVFVYDAETEVPYTMGEKYYAAEGLSGAQFDLVSVPEMTVGEAFGESDYAMTAGNRYAVMFYAADSNGNSFADMDQEVSGDQGPVINVRVMMDPQNCDHSAKEYTYERDDSVNARMTDNMDDLTHKVEPSYKRYCADCGTYLMNIWGAGTSQEHTMNNGVCTGCGYSAVPMMLASPNSLEKISFESHALGVLAGESYAITWDENGGSDEYIVNVKLLSGEPAYHDEEPGTSLVLNQRRSSNFVWVHVPETARTGQFIKVHVYGESNGIQTEAGNQLYLRVGCEHNDSSSKTVEKYYPIEGDETHHQCIEHYTHKCSECGFVLEETQSDPVVSEHEFYSDGRCSLCRYKKELPCDHEYSNRTLLSTRYEKKDDMYHNIVYTYKYTCRDCDMLIYSSMPEYREEKHVFNGSDTCAICGWNEDYGCSHYNETYTQMKNPQYGHDYLDEYEPLYHWVEWECVLSCADCGEVLEEEWTMSDMLLHDFDSNNRCKDCGYVGEDLIADNTVPRILSFSSSLGTTLTVGQMSTYTAVVYDENLRYVELSLNDELVLDSVMDPVSSTVDVSAWSFAGQAGTYKFIVTAVDYAGNSTTQELTITVVQNDDECLHTTYTDYENGEIKYTDNQDGKTHIWQNGYDRICNTCDESLGVVYGVENTADHDYSNGDECPCGYDRSSCSHTPSETKTYNRHIFAQFDEKQHQTIAIIWDVVCSSCGLTYEMTDTEGDENNPVGLKYDHEWENGKCKVQGCEYECAHAFEDIMLPDGNHKAENGIWESKGESGHWCTSIEWWEKCVNCGLEQKYTKNDPYNGEEQAHMMNALIKKYYNFDNNTHWLVGEKWQCTANGCDYDNYVEVENGAHEAHVDDVNGKCRVCGAQDIRYNPSFYNKWKNNEISGEKNNTWDYSEYDRENLDSNAGLFQLKEGFETLSDFSYGEDDTLQLIWDAVASAIVNYDEVMYGRALDEIKEAASGEQLTSKEYVGTKQFMKILATTTGSLYTPDPRYNNNEFIETLTGILSGINDTVEGVVRVSSQKDIDEMVEYLEELINGLRGSLVLDSDFEAVNQEVFEAMDWTKKYIRSLRWDGGKVVANNNLVKSLEILGDVADVTSLITSFAIAGQILATDMSKNIEALEVYKQAILKSEEYDIKPDPDLVRAVDQLIEEYKNMDETALDYFSTYALAWFAGEGAGVLPPVLIYNGVIQLSGGLMNAGGVYDDTEARMFTTYGESTIVQMLLGGLLETEVKIISGEGDSIEQEEFDEYKTVALYCYQNRLDQIDRLINSGAAGDKKAELEKTRKLMEKGMEYIQNEKIGSVY